MDVRIWPDSGLWDELVRTIPEATFFHSPLWHEIVVRTYPEYAIATCEFMLESGSRAVVPCIKTKTSGILKKKERLRSSVFGVYGGILAEGTLAPDCQEQIYRYFTKQKAKMSVHTNPFLPYRLPRSFECKDNFTHVFTIPAAGEDPSRRLSRGAKSNLNQARKKGVSVRIADCPQDVSAYYTVYRDTLRRWGDETLFEYPEQFFLKS